MTDIQSLTDFLIEFRDERHWAQFHNSKDLAIALSIEAAELNEIFLWKKAEEVEEVEKVEQQKIADELADVLVYALMFAHRNGLDVETIIREKMKKNGEKYPVDKAKGKATKYDQL
ncbi:MAG: nucleotide pyrophosphohydrolase [Bacteroidetes bacterium GWF2_49_14]|nr:MAG: nucleotide pyrophosphohydrolase [Bacteroidetes bacterium GWF2_49_14]HBB91314.1 nucleotide pyrophosphohydrolase [Bacteroidales bacterium]